MSTAHKNESALQPSVTKVLAVIVTYNPSLTDVMASISELIRQECAVFLVDNGSQNRLDFDTSGLTALAASEDSIELVFNPANVGLGTAHNQGIAFAKDNGFEYVLIMDQDSLPHQGMVNHLLLAHQSLSKKNKVSAVGACYLNVENQSESFFVRFGALKFQREYANESTIRADFLISSGSLFSVKALNDVGDMDEGLFIDHIDTEWFLRARDLGYQAFGVSKARMQHGLGDATHQINLGGRQRNVPQHKPFRYYYIFRNSVVLYKRRYTSWLWKWNDVQRLVMIFIMFGLIKSPRRQNMQMMLRGIWDGLLGRQGPVDLTL